MDRRNFLKWTGATALTGFLGLNWSPKSASAGLTTLAYQGDSIYAGWLNDPRIREQFIQNTKNPYLSQVNADIKGTGKGQTAFLWKFLEQVTGRPLLPHSQEIGDCVSHGYGLGVDILTATQILKRNSPQRWIAKAATEIIYAGGRIEIAKKEYGKNWRGDGMTGTVAAEFVKRYGILLRQKYLDKWDFTLYTGQRARTLGNQGVPDELEPLCKVHPVGCVTLVQSWEEARDCIYNGYPVPLCSNKGFNTRGGRDKDGFLSPSRNPWNHCMLLAGMDDNPVRPGGLIINSWSSDWIDGPKRYEQPDGSFWADASVIDRMCKQQDTVALSCYAGYPRQQLVLW
jgi:hypothetical protein